MAAPRPTLAGRRRSTVVTVVAATLAAAAAAATVAATMVPPPTAPAMCDVDACAAAGAAAVCTVGSAGAAATTCGAWVAAHPSECSFFCTQECMEELLCDSAGVGHCNLCMLVLDSCHSGFNVTGPVSGGDCQM